MSGMPWGEIAGAAGQTVNNRLQQVIDVYQFFKSIGDQEKMQQAIKEFRNIPNLDPKSLQYAASEMGVEPDVLSGKQRTDQVTALRQMQDIASKGGMDTAAVAANQQAGMQASRQFQADRAGLQNKLEMQGMNPGSGAAIAGNQAAAQASYNTLASAGAQNAANAQMRALQAINASGRLAGDLASSEEALGLQNQRARMERDRFNAGVKNAASQFNSDALMRGTQYNTNLAQAKIDPSKGATTQLRNEQTGYARDFGNREQLEGEQLGNMTDPFKKGKK